MSSYSKCLRLFKGACVAKFQDSMVADFFQGLGHVNIGVDNIYEGIAYYQSLLGVEPIRLFERFKNLGFAKSAGFLDEPDKVEVSIAFIAIPNTSITVELMSYHNPPYAENIQKNR